MRSSTRCCFNPGLGFLSVATSVSRTRSATTACFNPGLGFLSVATVPLRAAGRRRRVSIPVWVFSPSRLIIFQSPIVEVYMFQSRSGFSLRRDVFQRPLCRGRPVSIPVWVFSPSRPLTLTVVSLAVVRFNPGLGFLSVATAEVGLPEVGQRLVSIPVWVFSPSRRLGSLGVARHGRVSIPVWVFSPSRQGVQIRRDG